MTFRLRAPIVLSFLVWALGFPLSAVARPPVGSFVPDAGARGAPPLDGQVFNVETPRFAARMALLDDAARQKFLRARTGIEIDPFLAAAREGSPGFLTFLLELENRSDATLYFQPQMCPITTPQGDIRSPLDLETLQTSYEMLERTMPPAYAAAGKALFASQVALPPEGSASGLLVYRTADLRTRTLRVEVQATTATGETLAFELPYRFVKEAQARGGRSAP